MEIDPKKIDFGKMKSDKNSNGEIGANRIKGVDGINNNAKYNPAPSFTFYAVRKGKEIFCCCRGTENFSGIINRGNNFCSLCGIFRFKYFQK